MKKIILFFLLLIVIGCKKDDTRPDQIKIDFRDREKEVEILNRDSTKIFR